MQASGKLNYSLVSKGVGGKKILKCVSAVDFMHPFNVI